jgi:peptidoglycan/xylan/chitin deacetylase (PgdA/CDA1 family)
MTTIEWPDNKDFAFSIFDDTDNSTLQNVPAVYDFLKEYGFRTTKSVWPVSGDGIPYLGGATLENQPYLEWVVGLQREGFEIAMHNATYHSSNRKMTIRALDRFAELLGHYPKTLANHASCKESIYWGEYRVTGFRRVLYNIVTMGRYKGTFRGHIEDDDLFWGDYCLNRIEYVRNFVFAGINTLRSCPHMPYYDSLKPYVKYWFASTEGSDVNSFNRTLSERNQDKLEAEAGACIIYTHFASSFLEHGKLNRRFEHLMKRLSKKKGWFIPVGSLLDYIISVRGPHQITDKQRERLELRWMLHKLRTGHN